MTGHEIIEKMRAEFDMSDVCMQAINKIKFYDLFGPHEIVHQQGGRGFGTAWEAVYYFEHHDVYIRLNGYYNSWEDDIRCESTEVVVKKTISKDIFINPEDESFEDEDEESEDEESSSIEEEDDDEDESITLP